MMNKLLITLLFCTVLKFSLLAQFNGYHYQQQIEDVQIGWNSVEFPPAMVSKLNSDFSDIRILGVTTKKDTIEAPYFIREITSEKKLVDHDFNIINRVKVAEGIAFTFELKKELQINSIELNFKNTEFDWEVDLQGSQDLVAWDTILEDKKVFTYQTKDKKYFFSTLDFSLAQYRYFRLIIKTNEEVDLQSAAVNHTISQKDKRNHYETKTQIIKQDKENKETIISVKLNEVLPINQVEFFVSNNLYYRQVVIEYETSKLDFEGNIFVNEHQISSLIHPNLNTINFPEILLNEFKIIIQNNDNQPLTINDIGVSGLKKMLVSRMNEEADYYLVYGKKSARKPNYDITYFKEEIPEQLNQLTLLPVSQINQKNSTVKNKSFFDHSFALYGTLLLIALLLGYFTLKLMKSS